MGASFCGDRVLDSVSVPVEPGTIISENKPTYEAIMPNPMPMPKIEKEDLKLIEKKENKDENKEVTLEEKHSKIAMIQGEWRKKKEKEKVIERVRVLENEMSTIGQIISIEEMKLKITPAILKTQKSLPVYDGTRQDKENMEQKLIFRRPFRFNYDSSTYHGFWSSFGLREGYGVYIKEDGTVQEGLWIDGKLFKGRVFDTDGSYYEGDILEGEPHGAGRKVGFDGSLFTGQWKNGKQYLYGERTYADKYCYKGLMSDSLFNSKGKLTWPDGSTYEGEFNKSTIKGVGKFKSEDGETYEGLWNNNLANGKGNYTYNGKNLAMKYEGEYRNGKKEGVGKLTYKNETYYSGEWKSGLPHGNGEYKMNGTIYKGFWRYGRLLQIAGESSRAFNVSTEIIVKEEKEKFKHKHELVHLIDELEGVINDIVKQTRTFKPTLGSEVLNNVTRNIKLS